MIKNVLSSIGGVENFGIISICLFFVFFIGTSIWAFCQKRSHLDALSAIPLHAEENLEPVLKMGGAGDSPAPVGDSPTGLSASNVTKSPWPLARIVALVPSGESPDGTGQRPVLPKTEFSNTGLATAATHSPNSKDRHE